MATATLFQRAWVMLADQGETELGNIGPTIEDALKKMVDHGFSAVCVKLQDGVQEVNVGLPAIIKQRRSAAGLDGKLLVYGWSESRGHNPKDEVEKTNGLIARDNLDAWITASEYWKGDPGRPDYYNDPAWKKAKTFVDRALEIEPLRTLALTKGGWGFGYLPNEPAGPYIDWASINRLKGRACAECYPNQFPTEPNQWPLGAMDIATRGYPAFPKSYFHPLLGIYPSVQTFPLSRYISDLKKAKTDEGFQRGYGIYIGMHMTTADWTAAKAVNKPAGDLDALGWY